MRREEQTYKGRNVQIRQSEFEWCLPFGAGGDSDSKTQGRYLGYKICSLSWTFMITVTKFFLTTTKPYLFYSMQLISQ